MAILQIVKLQIIRNTFFIRLLKSSFFHEIFKKKEIIASFLGTHFWSPYLSYFNLYHIYPPRLRYLKIIKIQRFVYYSKIFIVRDPIFI